jgi:hypothetical protein
MHYSLCVAQERNGKTHWTRIGTMFENRDGNGFNLVFNALPIASLDRDGKIECRVVAFPPRDDDRSGRRDDMDDEIPL